MCTTLPCVPYSRDVAAVQALRSSLAYRRLLNGLDELVAAGVLRRTERQLLRNTADGLLFGDADGDDQLIQAEQAFGALLRRDVLEDDEVSALRERLWDIEPVWKSSPALTR
jgi:hypothetical protein